MEALSFVVPEWLNWISLPILILVLLVLDWCAATWLQPTHIVSIQTGKDATVKEIFTTLAIFSFFGAIFGVLTSLIDVSFIRTLIVEVMLLVCLMWSFALPKTLWIVAAVCYEAAFFIGDIAIDHNIVFAGIMMVVMIITILVLAITLGPMRSLFKK